MADAGYDVADYRGIEPVYGTSAEAEALIAEAHALGIEVLLDIVPNHTSDQHGWFRAALAAEPGPAARYLFRPGRGRRLPPNDWQSVFGGPAWTRVGRRVLVPAPVRAGPARPQLVPPRGARGVRGSAGVLVRQGRRRLPHRRRARPGEGRRIARPRAARRGTLQHSHAHIRPGTRTACTRSTVAGGGGRSVCAGNGSSSPRHGWPSNERLARYLRPDELHTAFQFDLPRAPWDAAALRAVIDESLAAARRRWARPPPGCCPTTTSRGTSRGSAARSRGQATRLGRSRSAERTRPRARHPAGPGGRAAEAGAARQRPTSTRARSWASGGRGPARRACCRTRPGGGPGTPTRSRRLPRAAALVGRGRRRSASRPAGAGDEPWLPQPADFAA